MRFDKLRRAIQGDVHDSTMWRAIYATDASAYRQVPEAVVIPKDKEDVRVVIEFARANGLTITPRAGGTSLAGQAVGNGIVVDASRHMNRILELNIEERWVRVQPGVIRDQLNHFLKPHGLFFSPITSTANRAMIGGMVGNNSSGSTSIVYGTTREHVLEITALLSDGSEATFLSVDAESFNRKSNESSLEGSLYTQIHELLRSPEVQREIVLEYPKSSIHRRNTGYAIDLLIQQQPFAADGPPFNFCTLLCGSEGSLAFTTEIKLHLDLLPPPQDVVVCCHFWDIVEAMHATTLAMQLKPSACEVMDKTILDCTRANADLMKKRYFVEGDPGAILMVEFRSHELAQADQRATELIANMQEAGYGYAFPKVYAPQTNDVWELRKAGLGVLGNLPGDAKSVSCIEDMAVALEDLPAYIQEMAELIARHGQETVYYAHAGAGELHIRPILNLKTSEGQQLFHDISQDAVKVVKKYNGSLSGEHGDGRVRAEFIPIVIGQTNYEHLRQIKQAWDPHNVFNAGKIVDPPPMQGDFRYEADQVATELQTVMDFSDTGGFMRMVEKCNGVGACRKLPESGGTMCPSYMATRNETESTRARANALREFVDNSQNGNPFDTPEVFDILKYCLSCKGCTNECPSTVDMSALKAEFTHQYYKSHRRPASDRAFAQIGNIGRMASAVPRLANWGLSASVTSRIARRYLGVAAERSIPKFSRISLRKWYKKHYTSLKPTSSQGSLYLFCDEFVGYHEAEIGVAAVSLLSSLGYDVQIIQHADSGRAQLSKGFLDEAKRLANRNVAIFSGRVSAEIPLVGIEPSAILTFRDEYLRLADDRPKAQALAANVLLIEEFLYREMQQGNIKVTDFTAKEQHILLHGHCHQKALAGVAPSAHILDLPQNTSVEIIPSGCCGMAGSFGYEKGNYELSMLIGEMVLFPAVRAAAHDSIIVAPGTSCRHQILDGTARKAQHPVEILWSMRGA